MTKSTHLTNFDLIYDGAVHTQGAFSMVKLGLKLGARATRMDQKQFPGCRLGKGLARLP